MKASVMMKIKVRKMKMLRDQLNSATEKKGERSLARQWRQNSRVDPTNDHQTFDNVTPAEGVSGSSTVDRSSEGSEGGSTDNE
jgi:hypothetical protein